MSGLWWLQPGWKETQCAQCGARIWPDGDPDWGLCWDCHSARIQHQREQHPRCDICGLHEACTSSAGYNVCSQECSDAANARAQGPDL